MDRWFNRLIDCKMNKERVVGEIAVSYASYVDSLSTSRDRLLDQLKNIQGIMKQVRQNIDEMESATKVLDSLVDNIALIVLMANAACKLVTPVLGARSAVKEGLDSKILVREYNKYWPHVNVFRAEMSKEAKDNVWRALQELMKETGSSFREHTTIHVCLELFGMMPSSLARRLIETTPEKEFAQRRKQVERTKRQAEQMAWSRIQELFSQINRMNSEYQEFVDYIRSC